MTALVSIIQEQKRFWVAFPLTRILLKHLMSLRKTRPGPRQGVSSVIPYQKSILSVAAKLINNEVIINQTKELKMNIKSIPSTQINLTRATKALIAALNDKNGDVRTQAAKALVQL